ncbi:MAG: pyrroline-5-carboxylate reductase [Aureliella sp.]
MAIQIVTFIGGGQMAQALAGGAIAAGVMTAEQLLFVEPNKAQQQFLHSRFAGCRVTDQLAQGVADAKRLVLSVKPHILKELAAELAGYLQPQQLLVSIAAGISLNKLQSLLGTKRVVRVMPNTPAQVGMGAAAIAADDDLATDDLQWVEQLFSAVGSTVRVPDRLMHAVTGLSGSGPAYVYLVIEALSDGGVAAGLPRDVATKLAAQTVLGAAHMVLETGLHPGLLKDQVTSPGGTTIAALATLEAAAVRGAFIGAVQCAAARSAELE